MQSSLQLRPIKHFVHRHYSTPAQAGRCSRLLACRWATPSAWVGLGSVLACSWGLMCPRRRHVANIWSSASAGWKMLLAFHWNEFSRCSCSLCPWGMHELAAAGNLLNGPFEGLSGVGHHFCRLEADGWMPACGYTQSTDVKNSSACINLMLSTSVHKNCVVRMSQTTTTGQWGVHDLDVAEGSGQQLGGQAELCSWMRQVLAGHLFGHKHPYFCWKGWLCRESNPSWCLATQHASIAASSKFLTSQFNGASLSSIAVGCPPSLPTLEKIIITGEEVFCSGVGITYVAREYCRMDMWLVLTTFSRSSSKSLHFRCWKQLG